MNLRLILFSDFVNFSLSLSELLQPFCNQNVIKERLRFLKQPFYTRTGEGQKPYLASFNRSHRKILYFLNNAISQTFATNTLNNYSY